MKPEPTMEAIINTADGTSTGLKRGYRVVRNGPGDITITAVWWRRVLIWLRRKM